MAKRKTIPEDQPGATETAAAAPKIELDTLLADVRAGMIDWFRDQTMTWAMQTETQRRGTVDDLHERAAYLVREVAKAVAADGRPVIPVRIGDVKHGKNGIECKIGCSKETEQRHALFDAVGDPALLVVLGAKDYLEAEPYRVPPDQADLDLGDDAADDDAEDGDLDD